MTTAGRVSGIHLEGEQTGYDSWSYVDKLVLPWENREQLRFHARLGHSNRDTTIPPLGCLGDIIGTTPPRQQRRRTEAAVARPSPLPAAGEVERIRSAPNESVANKRLLSSSSSFLTVGQKSD